MLQEPSSELSSPPEVPTAQDGIEDTLPFEDVYDNEFDPDDPTYMTSHDPNPSNTAKSPVNTTTGSKVNQPYKTPLKDKNLKEEVRSELVNSGGRTKLVKRTRHDARLDEGLLDKEEGGADSTDLKIVQEAGGKGGKREEKEKTPPSSAHTVVQNEEEEEDGEEFDPSAEIVKFDSQKELVDKWDEIQKALTPELKKWAEDSLKNSIDMIFTTVQKFHALNVSVQKDLREGVKSIESEEIQQEAKKTAILNFKMRLGAVAQTVKGAGIGHDGPK